MSVDREQLTLLFEGYYRSCGWSTTCGGDGTVRKLGVPLALPDELRASA